MSIPSRNYHIEFEYDGADFSGYQIQNDVRTIQSELQIALKKIYKEEININSAGRTDAGVHALAQSACFFAPEIMPCENVVRALNANLPEDIAVKTCSIKPDSFHPRFQAIYKIYRYSFYNGYNRKAIDRRVYYHHKGKLDITKIREAIKLLEGTHDFASFACLRGDESDKESTTRTIYEIKLIELPDNSYELYFKGEGFLYKMVRMLAGTILHYASSENDISFLLQYLEKPNRASAGPALPSHALTLIKVAYPSL